MIGAVTINVQTKHYLLVGERHSIPTVDEIEEDLFGAGIFSKLALKLSITKSFWKKNSAISLLSAHINVFFDST